MVDFRSFGSACNREATTIQEHDTERLLKPIPQVGLPVGAAGTIVTDDSKYSTDNQTKVYEVEFADEDGVTLTLVTVPGADLEVIGQDKSL